MTAAALLSRLDGVRQTAPGRWIARCPAHDDSRPSLTVRETPDRRTLLHCFAGCEVADVLDAIGCTWSDLFPVRDRRFTGGSPRRRERLASAADALKVLATEVRIVVLLAGDLAAGRPVSEPDRQRLLTAANRIARAEDACR